ncbi:MAG: hypothetical protein ACK4PR_10465 [Gammaproteobacteria bacterium]
MSETIFTKEKLELIFDTCITSSLHEHHIVTKIDEKLNILVADSQHYQYSLTNFLCLFSGYSFENRYDYEKYDREIDYEIYIENNTLEDKDVKRFSIYLTQNKKNLFLHAQSWCQPIIGTNIISEKIDKDTLTKNEVCAINNAFKFKDSSKLPEKIKTRIFFLCNKNRFLTKNLFDEKNAFCTRYCRVCEKCGISIFK